MVANNFCLATICRAPEIDMSELETLFSASVPVSDLSRKKSARGSDARKADKVQLVIICSDNFMFLAPYVGVVFKFDGFC